MADYYGFNSDDDKSLQSKVGVGFGLHKCIVKKFEFNPTASADGTPLEAIDFEVEIDGKLKNRRFYDVTKVTVNNIEVTDPASPELQKERKQLGAAITHIVKGLGVREEDIKKALEIPPTSFNMWARIMTALPKLVNGYEGHIFLQYQWNIQAGQKRTWIEIPKNMKGGYFFSPYLPGTWKEHVLEDGALTYVNEKNDVHPIVKSPDFMKSNWAKLQEVGGSGTNPLESTVVAGGWGTPN